MLLMGIAFNGGTLIIPIKNHSSYCAQLMTSSNEKSPVLDTTRKSWNSNAD